MRDCEHKPTVRAQHNRRQFVEADSRAQAQQAMQHEAPLNSELNAEWKKSVNSQAEC